MIVNKNGYQQSVFFSSGNSLFASLYKVSNSIIEYFYLRPVNEGLALENTHLKNELTALQNQFALLHPMQEGDTSNLISPDKEIRFIQAKVINNSTNKLQNYITLNKGTRDGIRQDMGVINEKGVVGIVSTVSEKFSVVIPIINPKIQINSKLKRNNYSGPVAWEGKDYRFADFNDIARHVQFQLGDSIVTSGYSNSFPEGLLVGTVHDYHIKENDSYYAIKVKLAVNYRTLTYVKVIVYKNYEEQINIEKRAQK